MRIVSRALLVASFSVLTSACSSAAEPPKTGDAAPDFTLKSLAGDDVTLSKLTPDHPVVLVVLRGNPGYQCPLCTKQVAALVAKADDLKAAQVLFVYPGPADQLKAKADEFVKGKDYPKQFTFLLDPDYTLVNAYGIRWEGKNETSYPSTFVIDTKGKVTFAKVSKEHGGRSSPAEVIAAVKGK